MEKTEFNIEDLILRDTFYLHNHYFTKDNKILITTHWDSHCSYLCSSREIVNRIVTETNLEGFYCTSKTEVYWGLYER